MTGLLSRLGLSWHRAVCCLLWIAMGVHLAVDVVRSLEPPVQWVQTLLMFVVAMALVYAGVGYALDLPGARVVVVVTSLLLTLYAITLVVFGTEDVGGLRVSVPIALVLVAFASYNLLALKPSARGGRGE